MVFSILAETATILRPCMNDFIRMMTDSSTGPLPLHRMDCVSSTKSSLTLAMSLFVSPHLLVKESSFSAVVTLNVGYNLHLDRTRTKCQLKGRGGHPPSLR